LADTHEVIKQLDLQNTNTKLLAIVANKKGAEDAMLYDSIQYIGFPFSISETFQLKNTNSTIAESVIKVAEIQEMCLAHNKKMVVYISMGFGNPYGDEYTSEIAMYWVEKLATLGITIFQISDTVGVSNPTNIKYIFNTLTQQFPSLEFGAHFHSEIKNAEEKIISALESNCLRFDSALLGIGGCPMAQNELVGNIDTFTLIDVLKTSNYTVDLDFDALKIAKSIANSIFMY
jgi:hydroxymethylglutaryl-CoA lyase